MTSRDGQVSLIEQASGVERTFRIGPLGKFRPHPRAPLIYMRVGSTISAIDANGVRPLFPCAYDGEFEISLDATRWVGIIVANRGSMPGIEIAATAAPLPPQLTVAQEGQNLDIRWALPPHSPAVTKYILEAGSQLGRPWRPWNSSRRNCASPMCHLAPTTCASKRSTP